MARLRHPALFTSIFKVKPEKLRRAGLFDPILNADTKLFVDPLLLPASGDTIIKREGVAAFDAYFGNVIALLRKSTRTGDVPWRNAERLFTFREPRETCLGYGDSTTHGNAIGPTLRAVLLQTAKEIIDLGVEDPKLFALMALLEDNIGADRISDLTTHAIKPVLYKLNHEILERWGVATEAFELQGNKYQLARNPFETSRPSPVLLLPKDILRQLPIAHDWSEVGDAAGKNEELRQRVSKYIGDIWAVRTRAEKHRAREAVLRDRRAYDALAEAVARTEKLPYDPAMDVEGHYIWREVLSELAEKFPVKIVKASTETAQELERIVDQIIEAFQDLVENKGQWEHFWHGDECRHERAVQRLFFAVADVYCKANNLDVSPEADSGGGPVDFKFSSGYAARLLVEIKLSTGKVVHGYEKQLEVYKKAESTYRARYLIVDVGGMGSKLEKVLAIKNRRAGAGDKTVDVIVVDGKPKVSASKR